MGRWKRGRARGLSHPTTSTLPTPPLLPHSEHRLHVKPHLRPGPNTLAITIAPAILEAFARNATYPYAAPILTYQSVAPYNFLRKPASDFRWDWGPAFAPSGIYGGVKVEGYSTGQLTGASIAQHHGATPDAGPVTLTVDAFVEMPVAGEKGTLTVAGAWSASAPVVLPSTGLTTLRVNITVPPPYDLWWPVGYGAQPLYNISVTYAPSDGSTPSSVARRVGLRAISLVRTPLGPGAGRDGDSFHFEVNGVPIFAKGSNMIPLHIFASKTAPADLRAMVDDSVAANMNMLRVWGGGLYPQDAFYDACDEKGMGCGCVGEGERGREHRFFPSCSRSLPPPQVSSSGRRPCLRAPCTPATRPSWPKSPRRSPTKPAASTGTRR